jgi:predicted ABC-type ATPase
MTSAFDGRPAVVALAGPDGAGKSTFYEAHLRAAGLRFIEPDALRLELGIDEGRATELAGHLRDNLVRLGESFVFETSLSDPEQQTLAFLHDTAARGYVVVLCFIGLDHAALCDQRVAMRALAGGPDVAPTHVHERYPRALANLDEALRTLPFVEVFDNSVSGAPHRLIARFEQGRVSCLGLPLASWFADGFGELLALPDEYAIESIAVMDGREHHRLRRSDGGHQLTITQPAAATSKRQPSERVHIALEDGQLHMQPAD